jgi:hypothetical protein
MLLQIPASHQMAAGDDPGILVAIVEVRVNSDDAVIVI